MLAKKEELKKALFKKAVGYDVSEEVSEYVFNENGDETLNKKKITSKHFSPDVSALKMFFEIYSDEVNENLDEMSDEELLKERERLLSILKNFEEEKCEEK